MDHAALIATLIACATALAVFGHRIVVQLIGRVDAMSVSLRSDMAGRFDEAERHRVESSEGYRAAWDARHQTLADRMHSQEREIADLRRQHEDDRRALVDGYVSRATWLEHVGTTNIKLDRLLEALHQHIITGTS